MEIDPDKATPTDQMTERDKVVRWYADLNWVFKVEVKPDDLFLTGDVYATESEAIDAALKLIRAEDDRLHQLKVKLIARQDELI